LLDRIWIAWSISLPRKPKENGAPKVDCLARTKVLLIDMPRMLRDIVCEVVADDPTFEIVGQLERAPDLTVTARQYDPEVIIAGDAVSEAEAIGALLEMRPRTRILTITDDGGQSILYRLSPEALALGDLSPARLREAMRA